MVTNRSGGICIRSVTVDDFMGECIGAFGQAGKPLGSMLGNESFVAPEDSYDMLGVLSHSDVSLMGEGRVGQLRVRINFFIFCRNESPKEEVGDR